jgi:peptide/nickel transport system ATP-binding protein
MVWQDYRLLPWRVVERNVGLGPEFRKRPEEERQGLVQRFLSKVRLGGFEQFFPAQLSGGMKQRVVMVLSSLLDPSLLIADEVTSALDVSSQRAVAELLVEFRDRGFVKSVIVITHDLSVLYQIADTILVMYAGKLAEKAPAETIINSPKHPYTQLLLSSLPEVGVRYSERRLLGIPGRPPSLLDPPTGSRFRTRCPLAFAKCTEEPPFVDIEAAHEAACWKAA